MAIATSMQKATAFLEMHQPGNPVVLINVWDVASAQVISRVSGTRAMATASWSISAAAGYDDGEDLPLAMALEAARRIVAATDLPVSVDFEKGYASAAVGVRENARLLIETGAIGLNIEDSMGPEDGALWSIAEAATRVAAVRAAADETGLPLVINARTDVMLGGGTVLDAIERGNAYLAAGADCIFVLGTDAGTIESVVRGIDGPVSVLAGARTPSVGEFAAAGVARVSFGPGPMGVAYAALARLAQEIHAGASNPPGLANRPGRA